MFTPSLALFFLLLPNLLPNLLPDAGAAPLPLPTTPVLDCPPASPPPAAPEAMCGSGKADDVWEPVCPPCGPGSCCTCGWAAGAASEECDGADLRGLSCTSLGYTSGQLRCTTGCKLDKTSCVTSATGTVYSLPELKDLFARFQPGLALGSNGTTLAIAFASGTRFDFFAFDVRQLPKVSVRGTAVVGGDYQDDAIAEFHSPKGPRTTAGRVVLAPLGADGDFVAAVQRFGKSSSTLVLRIHADGKIDAPIASYPGPPLFMVRNESRVLFGYSERGSALRLAVLGPDGKQIANAAAPLAAPLAVHDQLRASAAPAGDGWVVATGGADLSAPVDVVRVAADGTVGARKRAGAGTSTLVAAGDGAVVFRGDDGLHVYDEPTAPAASVLLAREQPLRLLAGLQASGPTLMVWMELGVGRVVRLTRRGGQDATSIASVVSVPGTRPVVGAVSGATVYLLFADEALRADPSLYVEAITQ